MADDSPIPKGRKPLERLEYIASPPVCPVIKRRVLSTPPPHGLSGSSPEVADSPFSRWDMDQRFRHRESRRELFLQNRLLEHQATEGRPGSSVEGSDNSGDDRDAADESYVTQGSYSDGDAELYLNSLSSQAGAFGFGTPMHAQGRRAFRSSYDRDLRNHASNDSCRKCPAGHAFNLRRFLEEHSCDNCLSVIKKNEDGKRCSLCDYDVCARCCAAPQKSANPSGGHLLIGEPVPNVAGQAAMPVVAPPPLVSISSDMQLAPVFSALSARLQTTAFVSGQSAQVPVIGRGLAPVFTRMKLKPKNALPDWFVKFGGWDSLFWF